MYSITKGRIETQMKEKKNSRKKATVNVTKIFTIKQYKYNFIAFKSLFIIFEDYSYFSENVYVLHSFAITI